MFPTPPKAGISQAALGVGLTFAFLVPVFAGIFLFWCFKRRNEQTKKDNAIAYARQISRPIEAKMAHKEIELVDTPTAEPGENPLAYPPTPPKSIYQAYRPPTEPVELDGQAKYI